MCGMNPPRGKGRPSTPNPILTSTGEFTGPASMISPAISTPSTSATVIASLPVCGTSVANPRPSTIVSGRATTIGSLNW